MNYWKLGCRWGSKKDGNPLFFELLLKHKIVLSWTDKDYGKNSTLILTDGHTVIGVGKTTSDGISAIEFPEFEDEFRNHNIDFSKDLLIYKAEIYPIEKQDSFDYKLVQGICGVVDNDVKISIKKLIIKYQKNMQIENISNLLSYKKQIILQGPPGTGKTRLAKKIALKMIGYDTDIDLNNYLKKGILIPNASGVQNYYLIEDVKDNGVELSSEKATKKWSASFNKIKEKISQLQRGESPKNKGGDDPYVLAVAKYVFQNFKNSSDTLENNNQVKLVQFHPSYTYEDFVRGIVAKPAEDGNGILYEAENKILGKFANAASINYNESINTITVDVVSNFTRFIDYIIEEIDEMEKFMISDTIYIFYVDEKRFKYKGDNWTTHSKGLNMNFSELQKIITLGLNTRKDINKSEKLNALTRQHATYYQNFVELYKGFLSQNPPEIKERILKNYVLIIDEINRANLSSVLGELIYALEYRGEEVESMYEVDGIQKLILPPNLYIVGTMNTADRSVGHIDYAIRRRFAFVDVHPENLKISQGLHEFDDQLFEKVAAIFDTNLSPEFKKEDVQLGHSYFIDKTEDGGTMTIRLQYEIKPILLEYVKDGILVGEMSDNVSVEEYINSLTIS